MWRLRGHEAALAQIDKSFKAERYAHAYLLVGPAQVGKGTLAIDMAQAANCLSAEDVPCGRCIQCVRIAAGQHADVVVIGVERREEDGPPRKEIGIDDVRDVQRQASLKPYEGKYRVFIFDGSEHMSEEAANALLKTLEEPPPQVMLILLACQEEALLPTIRSRCRRLELKPLPLSRMTAELVDARQLGEGDAAVLGRLSMGRLGWSYAALADPSIMEKRNEDLSRIAHLPEASLEDRYSYASDLASMYTGAREAGREALNLWARWWRDLLLIKEGAGQYVHNVDWADTLNLMASTYTTGQVVGFIRAVLRTIGALEHNANARLALEVLMLTLPAPRR